MNWFKNFLCKIGIHDWETVDFTLDRDLKGRVIYSNYCRRCGKGG